MRACVNWVMAMLVAAGFVISAKSMLEPARRVKWLGKVVDVKNLMV